MADIMAPAMYRTHNFRTGLKHVISSASHIGHVNIVTHVTLNFLTIIISHICEDDIMFRQGRG